MVSDMRHRQDIIEIGRRIHQRGWISATDGNISVKLDDNRILTTPTGVHKGYLDLDDFVIVDMDGKKVSGKANPSSELAMHLACYRLRPDVKAVIHAHPTFCIAMSVAGVKLAKCLLPEVVFTLGSIPTADYAPPTTEEVPRSIEGYIQEYDALILERHGSLTVGDDLFSAYNKLERMEHVAEITYYARQLGGAKPLSSEQMAKLIEIRRNMGMPERAVDGSCNACNACNRFSPETNPNVSDGERRVKSCTNSPTITAPTGGKTLNITPELIEMITKEVTAELKELSK